MISCWLALPLPERLAVLAAFSIAVALLLVILSFGSKTTEMVRSFRGVVAPFVGTVAVIFGILLGFLANDIWDRERRAAASVRSEAESLLSLTALAATFDLPREPLAGAVRTYAATVVSQEWPSMARGESAPAAELALDQLLKTIAGLDVSATGTSDLQRLLLDSGLNLRIARNTRLRLSRDESEELKWLLVLVLAVTTQIAVAAVHLESIRPQIAALAIWTTSVVIVLSLLALYDEPFAAPNGLSPVPIAHVLDVLGKTAKAP
jgi:heme A synthase